MIKKILIVDDDANFVKTLSEVLEEEGYEVHSAQDGFSAMQAAVKAIPDVVLLDYKLPGGSGPLILERLHSNVETFNIPVVMVTGVTDEREIEQVRRMGVQDVFHKPLDIKLLLATLKKLSELK